jgi:hypothetical protein
MELILIYIKFIRAVISPHFDKKIYINILKLIGLGFINFL